MNQPPPDLDSPPPPPAARSRSWGLIPALRFLLPPGDSSVASDPDALRRAPRWFAPIGLAIGLLWIAAFRTTWRLYGEVGSVRPIPALAVILIECLLTGPFLAMGLARTAHLLTGDRPRRADEPRTAPLSPVGTLVLALIVLTEFVFIFSIPAVGAWWPQPSGIRRYFNLLFPQPIYQPLLLAPVWGRWGVLLGAAIGRTARGADPATVALCETMSPMRLLRLSILPLVLTIVYCGRSHNYQMGPIVALTVFGLTYLVAVVMAWRGGGQTRQSLFAAGQIAQLVFLAAHRAFWPWIHG